MPTPATLQQTSATTFASMLCSSPRRWLNRFWPSTRLRDDPLCAWRVDERYAPVSIANLKLTPAMRRVVLGRRRALPLSFDDSQRLTVVIPFRDREAHLHALLPVLTAVLEAQRVRFRILVVEQGDDALFNRGKLINAGVQHAAATSDYFCLHDVDALPVTANYLCPSQPLRLVHRIRSAQGDALRADYYFSGAVSIRKEQLLAANGYSNGYRGWGKEDDDLFFRLLLARSLCYYDLLGEFHDLPNPHQQQVSRSRFATPAHVKKNRRRRSDLMRGLSDPSKDGLNTVRYEIIDQRTGEGCERIRVRW